MELFEAKKAAVTKEESRRTLNAQKSGRTVKFSKAPFPAAAPHSSEERHSVYSVDSEVVLREVWMKQAHLLIQQVKSDH